ncbi:hypothetical protein MSAN_00166800 [Mycena sanguinolenta]|uniref:Uncharacterized protein n=1 Tax=Mycena sanguinolenta TaxID=230812 RepID=A0A8H6ZJE0_9AGAR|nr:hypothetical protein MSAN_00166800 [Mycena sanguinolenta]
MNRDVGISVTFALLGLSSAVVSAYRWRRTTRPKIALELGSSENNHSESKVELQSSIQSPVFDLAKPDDFIDGSPIDEAAFRARIRWRKLVLLVVLVAVLFSTSSASTGTTGTS